MDQSPEAAQDRRLGWVSRTLDHQVVDWTPSPKRLGYRARIRLSPNEAGQLGFHPPRSSEVLPIEACPVAHPALAPAIAALPRVPRGVANLELRTDGTRVVAAFEAHHGGRGDVRGWVEGLDAHALAGADLAVDGKRVRGPCHVEITAGGITHLLSPGTFYQVNLALNMQLVDDVRAVVLARSPSHVLDAFAGAGNLSMPIAAAGVQVTQIEQHPAAVRDARNTARRHGLEVTTLQQGTQDFKAGDVFFDLAIVDPPRSGTGKMMGQLLMTRPAALVMVSCNPHTLAKDLRQAKDAGYRLSTVGVYEMFPQTEHAEVLAVLDR